MRITIQYNSNETAPKNFSFEAMKDSYKFGLQLVAGISSIKSYKAVGNIHFKLEQNNKIYNGLCYTKASFLSKAVKAVKAFKSCIECGNLVLCECHDKCHKCVECETADKTMSAVTRLGDLVFTVSAKFNKQYDDKREQADDES